MLIQIQTLILILIKIKHRQIITKIKIFNLCLKDYDFL
jgi:hypothetical protein